MCCKDEERDKEWRKVENERLRANISGLLDEIRSLLEEEKEGEILERERGFVNSFCRRNQGKTRRIVYKSQTQR